MRLSAVIPCFGRQEYLDQTLATLLAQTRPLHEIIVVDDGSEEPICVPDGVRLLRIERSPEYRGSSTAKNFGAVNATGDWLVFSDNDILHHPEAAERVCRLIEKERRTDLLVNVISTLPPEHGKPAGNIAAIFHKGALASSEQHFGVIHREFFLNLGGYDSETFKSWGFNNQDLCLRVIKAGGKVTSNVFLDDGAPLVCYHMANEPRDNTDAKREFRSKYGRDYSPYMLKAAS